MNVTLNRKNKGFTLIEILIALALLAIISAVVIPNVVGFLGRGEEQAYKADKKVIQGAVDAYYADPATRVASGANKGKKIYPLQGTEAEKISGGTPTYTTTWSTTGFFINFDTLVTGKYINDVPASASSDHASGTGSYSWYVKTDGRVESKWVGDHSNTAFVTGVYP